MSADRRSFLKAAAASAAFVLPAVAAAQSPRAAPTPDETGRRKRSASGGGVSKTRLARMHEAMARHFFPGFWDHRGWGFGMAIVTRRDDLARSVGTYGWDGGYGTSWYADPREDMTGILMTQRVWDSPVPPAVNRDFWTSAYQAIDD